jgi:secondary thiamine-phosphate synthase enzyme
MIFFATAPKSTFLPFLEDNIVFDIHELCHEDSIKLRGERQMKSLTEHLTINTKKKREYINITDTVESLVKKSGIKEGLCLVNAMHITASVYINDAESGLIQDFEDFLEGLAPHEPISRYRHNRTGEDNGDAHIKRTIMGREVVVAVTGGKLDFGPWEQIYYAEFDGQRPKRVMVKIIGE